MGGLLVEVHLANLSIKAYTLLCFSTFLVEEAAWYLCEAIALLAHVDTSPCPWDVDAFILFLQLDKDIILRVSFCHAQGRKLCCRSVSK